MDSIISKQDARKAGLTHYFTGKPCCHGHISVRYVKTGRCKSCKHIEAKLYLDRGYFSQYYRTHKDRISKRAQAYNLKYSVRNMQRVLTWRKNNEERYKIWHTNYMKNIRYPKLASSGLGAFYCRKYQIAKQNAQPKWADEKSILEIYKNCPTNMTVDHIIPLRGKLVCGLHVENNLQYLTNQENASKNNRFHPIYT